MSLKMQAEINALQDRCSHLEAQIADLRRPMDERLAELIAGKLDASVLRIVKAALTKGPPNG
jgi:hypothetical protein